MVSFENITEKQVSRLSQEELSNLLEVLRREELRRAPLEEAEKTLDQLIQTEKLASLGILARGVAHEFNNLFSGVIGYCSFALSQEKTELMKKALEVSLAACQRASMLVENLQSFAGKGRTKLEAVDVREALKKSLQLIGVSLKFKKIKLKKKLKRVSPVKADKLELQQVFLNLLANAMQAVESQGAIRVNMAEEGGYVDITFTDDGCGIPEENLPRIFEPFFSTKGVHGDGKAPGTGLGLSVCYGIVAKYGGTIRVESEVDKGSTFVVRLPVLREEGAPGDKARKGGRREGASREDENRNNGPREKE
jgi:signal transduction histidine kinase